MVTMSCCSAVRVTVMLFPLELRCPLLDEGPRALAVVFGLADEAHVRGDQVEVGAEVLAQSLVNGALGGANCQARPAGDAPSELVDGCQQLVGWHDAVDHPDPFSL